MDYQTFNSQHTSFGGPFSTLPGTPAHLAQPTHSPQQQQQFADPHGRFLQSTPSPFPYGQQYANNGQPGGYPNMGGGVAANGGLMQPGGGMPHNQLHQARVLQQQQQQQQQQQHPQQQQQQQHPQLSSPSPYSSAPYSQPVPSPANPQFVQNRQTASPSNANNHGSPYASNPQTQQPSPSLPSNTPQPMNAAANQPQASQAMQVQTPVKALPQSPVSPVAQARDKERVTTLLEINTLLLKEVVELQTQGKAGQIGPPPAGQEVKPEDKPKPSNEYIDCMRRLQSNLAFLAQNAESNKKPNQPIQPGPAIMTAPSSPPELIELYTKLQGLYPGWKGQQSQMKVSPGPQRLNSSTSQPGSAGGGSGMQPPNSAGLHNNMQPPNSAGLPPNM